LTDLAVETKLGDMKIIKSRAPKAVRVLLYGQEGIGKTTWASQAPAPIFIAPEQGAGLLSIDYIDVHSYDETIAALAELAKTQHDYKSVVIDTIDQLDSWVRRDIEKKHGRALEDMSFGKGYVLAEEAHRELFERCNVLWQKGINIICLAHADVKKYEPPEGVAYTAWSPRLQNRTAKVWCEGVDAVLFASFVQNNGSLERVIQTTPSVAWTAKNRFGLNAQISMKPSDFWDIALVDWQEEYKNALAKVDEETRQKCQDWLASKGATPENIRRAVQQLKKQKT